MPEGLGFEEWQAAGEWLKRIESGHQWWIGDWLRYGERRYGEMYSQALDATDYEYQTLKNAKWVAEQYPELSLRKDNLSWSHHLFAASLPQEERSAMLDEAEREGWSAHDLRRAVRRSRLLPATPAEPPHSRIRLPPK